MKFIATTSNKINTIAIKANQMIFSTDDKVIYLDKSETERIVYTTIIVILTDDFRLSITNPVKAFYFVEETSILYRYDGTQWIQLTTPPQESLIFLKRENFPTIGKTKTLYIDDKAIYQWSETENDYVNMNGNSQMVWENM